MKTTISGCPIEDAMRLLSGRWRTLLVYYLIDGKKRFAQLRRDNPKISHRILTHELRALESAGVITRTVIPGKIAHVEYELTEAGHKLVPLINALGDWYEDLQRRRQAEAPQLTAS
ncbi:helix-turn-helix transcriptional regulator [Steroidobacter sp. S1-65]|uniref:Helix-turn-helix transcriptional regulator n=1 Tax=Steroidobacter gossypii TaxID=2805490 RepID=A0ABS1X5Y9_9GAMM|nr:helix-turn-helix domain-containing protein [Steroidobacter gossypii]MBM0108643.1 helix-turn-helix transcriptional regulator [Steroidobacter gossypii]